MYKRGAELGKLLLLNLPQSSGALEFLNWTTLETWVGMGMEEEREVEGEAKGKKRKGSLRERLLPLSFIHCYYVLLSSTIKEATLKKL